MYTTMVKYKFKMSTQEMLINLYYSIFKVTPETFFVLMGIVLHSHVTRNQQLAEGFVEQTVVRVL
jgi:hypothetical protein